MGLSKFLLYVLQRLFFSITIIIMIMILIFILINVAHGDPAELLAGEAASPQYIETIRKAYGLDKPPLERMIIYIYNLLKGDWGYSITYQAPVIIVILQRLPQTLLLVGVSLIIAIFIGIGVGIISASKPNSLLDMTLNTLILGAYSLPVFWLGLILIMILSLQIPLFPTGGIIDVSVAISGNIIDKILNILWHMVLPIFTLSIIYMATYARVTRSVVMDVMKSNFIKAAIARGVPYKRILYVYALKNALIPVIAVAGAQFGLVVAGAVLTETVYSWPGIGTLLVQAVNYRDYPLVIGVLILVGISVAISNFVADLLMARIDPRIKSRLMG